MSFIRWQVHRGVLEPPSSARRGAPRGDAVNERLLRDGCESVALTRPSPRPTDFFNRRTVDEIHPTSDQPYVVSRTQRERSRASDPDLRGRRRDFPLHT